MSGAEMFEMLRDMRPGWQKLVRQLAGEEGEWLVEMPDEDTIATKIGMAFNPPQEEVADELAGELRWLAGCTVPVGFVALQLFRAFLTLARGDRSLAQGWVAGSDGVVKWVLPEGQREPATRMMRAIVARGVV